MFPEQLKKILNFVKKTGDRVILFDANTPDDSFVVMDFEAYASSFSNKELKSVDSSASIKPDAPLIVENPVANNSEISLNISKKENLTEEDLTDRINREISLWKNQGNIVDSEGEKPRKAWQIPPKVKDKAQEVE